MPTELRQSDRWQNTYLNDRRPSDFGKTVPGSNPAIRREPTSVADHLIKRNPSLASRGVLSAARRQETFTESRVNGTAAGARAQKGDRIWVAETGYGVYGVGTLIEQPELIRFESITDLLDRLDDIPVQDPPYLLSLIRKIHGNANFKFITVLVVPVELRQLDQILEIPQRCRTQGSWYYLNEGELDEESSARAVGLTSEIPGVVRLKVYQQLARATDRHIIDVDHFVPKSVGGPGNLEENLVPVSYSLNRAKRDRIPSGLFLVAAKDDELRRFVPPELREGGPKILPLDSVISGLARKVVAEVNSRSDVGSIRDFYARVKKLHFG